MFKRADDLAVALLARGYVSGAKRTYLHELRMEKKDYGVLAAVIGILILAVKMS